MHSSTSDFDRPQLITRWHVLVATVVSLAAVIGIGIKQVWAEYYDLVHEDHYLTMAHESLQQNHDAPVLVVGTSHMRTGLNPEWTGVSMVSLNHPALDYVAMEQLLLTHSDRLDSFRVLVLDLDPFALEIDTLGYMHDSVALHRLGMSPWTYDGSITQRVKLYLRKSPLFYSPGVNPQAVMERILGQDTTVSPGYRGTEETMESTGSERAEAHERAFRRFPDRAEANRAALLRILEFAKQRGMTCILVRMPHVASYWKTLDAMYRSRIEELIEETTAYDHVVVWDLDDPDALKLSFNDFRDGDHLNEKGAAKFSRAFGERLSELLSRNEAPHR